MKLSLAARMVRRFAVVAAVALAIGPDDVWAQDWLPLHDQSDSRTLLLDPTSVKSVSDKYRSAVLDATWKEQTKTLGDWSQITARIDCEQASVLVLRKQTYTSFLPNPAQRHAEYDYIAGTRTDWRGTTPLSEAEQRSAEQVLYPADDLLNKVVRRVCSDAEAYAERNERSGERIQKEAGCDTAAPSAQALCSGDIDTRELLGRFVLRTSQVHRVCSISLEQLYPLLKSRMTAAQKRCGDDARCFRADLGWIVTGFGRDLSTTKGESCRYTLDALDALASDKKREDGIARFSACAIDGVKTLDDRTSPADVVARGVFGVCRRELTEDLARSAAFESKALPGLVGAVLQARQKAPRPPSKRPATKPEKTKPT
jgi:hypothetical protein